MYSSSERQTIANTIAIIAIGESPPCGGGAAGDCHQCVVHQILDHADGTRSCSTRRRSICGRCHHSETKADGHLILRCDSALFDLRQKLPHRRRLLIENHAFRAAVACVSIALGAEAPAHVLVDAYGSPNPDYYRSADGYLIHRPTKEDSPGYGTVTADCRDGTHSYSRHQRGTCNGHGGVSAWRDRGPSYIAPSRVLPAVIGPSGSGSKIVAVPGL